MDTFCIQIQPDRAPELDLERVRMLCAQLASDAEMVVRHGVIEGEDEGPYLNLMFEIAQPLQFWRAFQKTVYADAAIGAAMGKSSMATCTGEQGWDDYLLLYHYDKALALDVLEDH